MNRPTPTPQVPTKNQQLVLILAASLIYIGIFLGFANQAGEILLIMAVLPATAIGWFYGLPGGIIAGVVNLPISWLLLLFTNNYDPERVLSQLMIEYLFVASIGLISGWAKEMNERLLKQTQALSQQLSESSRMEVALVESEARYRRMIEQAGDVVYLVNQDGHFEYINPFGELFLGYTFQELIAMTYRDLIPEDWIEQVTQAFDQQAENRIPEISLEFPVITATGKTRWMQQITNLLVDDGEVTGFQSFARDITETKNAQVALAAARDEAMAANKAKSRLLDSITHDIRAPLSAILGYASLLLRGSLGKVDERQEDAIEKIVSSTHHVSLLIDNLLNQAELERGQPTLHNTEFRPAEILQQVEDVVILQVQEKGLTLNCILAPELPPTLIGDYRRLTQILLNLVNNAIKFTEQGEVTITIGMEYDDTWFIRVQDTGTGIPVENQGTIFNAFQKANGGNLKSRGFGLGLSIVKEFTQMMGGDIHLDSTPGEGSTFVVTLPLSIPAS